MAWITVHIWDCFCCFGNAIHINISPIGTAQCCSVMENSRSADDLLGQVGYGRCFVRHIGLSFLLYFKLKINKF